MNQTTTRALLIDAIIDLAADELDHKDEFISLAKQDERQLIENLIHIAQYYRDELND
jgi:hypothetical protein